MEESNNKSHHEPWNKDKLVGQKAPFKLKEIWAIRVRLQIEHRVRELAMFDLGLDSKLRACDLVKLKVRDICHGDRVAARAIIMQQKTGRPVQFEITASTQEAVSAWIKDAKLRSEDFLFPSRIHKSPHLGTRQYARIVDNWVQQIGIRSGPGCLNNISPSFKWTPAGCQRCRVIHGGERRLRRTQSRGG